MTANSILILQILLRLFGAFWIIGGFFTLQAARESYFIDTVLDALSPVKEDRLVSHFLLAGSILTIASGAGLLLSSRWVFLPLGALILSQLIYFTIQNQRLRRAKTPDEREEATVSPATINAFNVSVVITLITSFAYFVGALR